MIFLDYVHVLTVT